MIESSGPILRLLKAEDLDRASSSLCAPLSNNFFSLPVLKKSFAESGLWNEELGLMAAEERKEKKLLFIFWYKKMGLGVFEIGYGVLERDARLGRALELFASYLFSAMPMNRQQLEICEYDKQAIAAAKEAGFTFEGILRGARFSKGNFCDLCIYSKLKAEESGLCLK